MSFGAHQENTHMTNMGKPTHWLLKHLNLQYHFGDGRLVLSRCVPAQGIMEGLHDQARTSKLIKSTEALLALKGRVDARVTAMKNPKHATYVNRGEARSACVQHNALCLPMHDFNMLLAVWQELIALGPI